jgi:hypothetical protein
VNRGRTLLVLSLLVAATSCGRTMEDALGHTPSSHVPASSAAASSLESPATVAPSVSSGDYCLPQFLTLSLESSSASGEYANEQLMIRSSAALCLVDSYFQLQMTNGATVPIPTTVQDARYADGSAPSQLVASLTRGRTYYVNLRFNYMTTSSSLCVPVATYLLVRITPSTTIRLTAPAGVPGDGQALNPCSGQMSEAPITTSSNPLADLP